jgi:hypothetical protein
MSEQAQSASEFIEQEEIKDFNNESFQQLHNKEPEINTAQRLYYTKWHKSGVEAKQKGWSRDVTPYYNNNTADYFFHCGFDGVKLEDAIQTMQDEMKDMQVIESLDPNSK